MKKKITGYLLAVLLASGIAGCEKRPQSLLLQSSEETVTEQVPPQSCSEAATERPLVQETEDDVIYVDVCGAVKTPGVYRMSAEARVYEAIALAGGFLEEADADALNQAQRLTDGAQVRVYTVGEAQELAVHSGVQIREFTGHGDGQEAGSVNLNTADLTQLCTLPGIGEARAADIIAYRMQHGGFQSIEEIMNVSGIKDATFQKLKDKIAVK